MSRVRGGLGVALALATIAAFSIPALASAAPAGPPTSDQNRSDYSPQAVHQDVSPPLRDIPPARQPTHERRERPQRGVPEPPSSTAADPVVQSSSPSTAAPAPTNSFEGIGEGLSGFKVLYAPPDTNGDVGLSDYVQIVNVDFAVFSKTSGALTFGPVPTNTLFSGFGGGCQT